MKHNVNQNKKTKKARSKTPLKKTIEAENKEIKVELLFLGEYFNIHTFQMHPITPKFVQQEAQRLREWAMLDSSLVLCDFTDDRGYNPNTFYDWCAKYPEIHEAHQFALRRIGSRREQGAMSRRFAESTIHRTLGYYSQIWASETYKLSKMKEEIAAASENKIVVIERFPSIEDNVPRETPEEVAAKIHRATGESRFVGSYDYNTKSRMGYDE